MSKFRTWLIKKLGGTINSPTQSTSIVHITAHPLNFLASMILSASDVKVDEDMLFSYAQEKLASKLTKQLIDENAIKFTLDKDEMNDKYTYNASLCVIKEFI